MTPTYVAAAIIHAKMRQRMKMINLFLFNLYFFFFFSEEFLLLRLGEGFPSVKAWASLTAGADLLFLSLRIVKISFLILLPQLTRVRIQISFCLRHFKPLYHK